MKTKVAPIALIAIAGLLAIQAVPETPAAAQQEQRSETSAIEQELLDTLTQAFDERLAEYEAGRAAPTNAIRLNKELYDAQIAEVDAEGKTTVAEERVERAKQIEEIAARQVDEGTGTSTTLLETKASRLKAVLELQRVKNEFGSTN